MKQFATLSSVVFFLAFANSLHAQQSSVFFDRQWIGPVSTSEMLNASASPLEYLGYDTTLYTRIVAAMTKRWNAAHVYDRHGVAFSVLMNGAPQITGAIGTDTGTIALDTTLLFEVGSVSKTFTAALIMKLQEEGKLSLTDSLHKWLRAYNNIDTNITILQLLNHSSGIYDYINDDPNKRALEAQYSGDPSKHWTPEDVLQYVGSPNFKPGARYRYCNTGYVLLAMIAEKAGGASLRDQLHANFIDPLHLTHTYVGGYDSIPETFAHDWQLIDTADYSDLYDIQKTAHLSGSFGDGEIVSTPGDLARWGAALYLAKVLTPASIIAMTSPLHTIAGAGLFGLGTQEAPYYTRKFFGHSGHMLGFVTEMFTNMADSVTVVAYLNADGNPFSKTPSLNDYLVDVLKEVYSIPSGVAVLLKNGDGSISVYPNPVKDHATFSFDLDHSGSIALRIYDVMGREVMANGGASLHSGHNTLSIELSSLRRGNYFYTLQTSSGAVSGKFEIGD